MKINNKMPNPMANAEAAKAGKTAKSSGADAISEMKSGRTPGAGNARVDLSVRAQDMAKARELATPSDNIDEAKVARLQKLIDEGKYSVDAEAIADRLLDEQSKMS